jgi:hypothetical protein
MKDLDYYSGLPYRAVAEPVLDEHGERLWRARLEEIPSLQGFGETEDEAVADLRERFIEYIGWRLDMGLDIPEPDIP